MAYRARHEDAPKSELRGLAHTSGNLRDGAQLAREPDLAHQRQVRRHWAIVHRGGNGHRHRQVGGRFIHSQATDDIDKDILIREMHAHPPAEHGCHQQQAVEVHAIGSAPRVAEGRGAGQSLQFDQQRARAFHGDGDGGSWSVQHPLGQEGFRGIGHLDHACALHFEDADFGGGSEAILYGTQQPEALEAIAFQVKHRIHNMLEHPRPGDGAFFGHVADEEYRDA